MARADLLEYLQRYRDTQRRKLGRVERWRRRYRSRGQIADAADALASRLHTAGVRAGDRVGIYVKDGPLWAAALFGVLRAGAAAVPLDAAHPPDLIRRLATGLELAAWLADAELPRLEIEAPRIDIGWGRMTPAGAPPPMPADEPGRVAQLVLTSGTTGSPQSVAVSHENQRVVLDALVAEISRYRRLMRLAPRLRLAVALPLSHLYGQFMGVLLPVALQADVAMLDTMPASELAAAVRREHAWALATVPHVLASLLSHLLEAGRRSWGDDGLARRLQQAATLSWPRRWLLFDPLHRRLGRRMVAVVSGGASLDGEVERLWRLLGYAVIQGYGLTEAAPLVAVNHPFRARPGSVGKPLPGIEVRLADDGEILVRGRNVASASGPVTRIDAGGWLHTGDLGKVLDDGSISFRGRISDRIVTPAGVNVDLQDVAAALRAADGVIDATATELPWGEPGTVCAVLVVVPGTDVEDAVRRANRRLADAAHVRSWFIWPLGDLPRTPTGKIRRAAVMQWLERQAPPELGGDAVPPPPGDGPVTGVDRVLQAIANEGAGAAPAMANVPVAELLSSLDRVELAARLEGLYGGAAGDAVFADAQTVGGLVAAVPRSRELPDRSGARSRAHPQRPDPAAWRFWWPARVARFVLRELVMHPLARALVRLEVESGFPLDRLHGPALLAANHTSYLDPIVQFVLPASVRSRVAPAARWNFFAEHAHGNLLYFCGVLGVNVFPLVQGGDWRPTLRIAGELADRGYSILIFPEGKLSRDGELHTFQRGVAVMSRELHLPVVPCAVAGLERVLPPGGGWRRLLRGPRARVAFCVGTPLSAVRPGDEVETVIAELETAVRGLRRRARSLVG